MRKYLFVFCSLICTLLLSSCSGFATFNGSRTGNESQLKLEYSVFDTTDSQSLDLQKGDVLDVEVVSTSGTLSACVQKDEDTPIYENENIPTGTFNIEIKESGTYKVTVTGVKAKGSISFVKQNGELSPKKENTYAIHYD